MAKQSTSPAKDPAALAFSAVEAALKDSVFSIEDAKSPPAEQKQKPAKTEKPAEAERQRSAKRIAGKTSSPANDDAFAAQRILYSMQSRPSAAPIWIAALLSILWLAGTGVISWLRFGEQLTDPQQFVGFSTTAEFAGLLAIAFLPVLGFFAVGILVRRAQELRVAAASMTQAAIRLAEPETTAADKVASVGQAVRREVNALGDGLERALSRAGELEVMVHNEVTSLERTYSDNEARLRSLIQELAAQREAVVTNADRVREAIVDAHSLMIEDLDKAGDRMSSTILDRGRDVRNSIEEATESLNSAFSGKSDKFVKTIDGRTADIVSMIDESADRLNLTLEDRSSAISNSFDSKTTGLANILDERLGTLSQELDTRAIAMAQSLDQKIDGLSTTLESSGNAIIADLESRGYAMSGTMESIGNRIVGEIGGRTDLAERTLTDLTDRLDETISVKVNSLESRLQSALIEIESTMDETTEAVQKSLTETGQNTLSLIGARAEEASVIIEARLKDVDAVLSDKGEKVIDALTNHTTNFNNSANLLENALDEKTEKLDTTISNHQQALTEQISARTREFAEQIGSRTQKLSEILEKRTGEFSSTLTERTRTLSESLELETRNLRDELATGTTAMTDAIRSHTDEIGRTIEGQSIEVRRNIDDALVAVTDTMDVRSDNISTMITSKIADVNEAIGREVDSAVARLSDAESSVTARIDTAALSIAESADTAARNVEVNVEKARSSITEMVDDRLGSLPESITARADITAERLAALNENINHSLTKSMADLEASADKMEETIGTRIVGASANVANDIEQTASRMDLAVRTALEQIRSASAEIEDLVEVRAVNSVDQIAGKVENLNRTVAEHTDTFAEFIDARTGALENALQNHKNVLREALAESAIESEQLMSESNSRILSEVNDALSKLNDGNLLLQQVLEASGNNLANLESSVADQTAHYSSVVKTALETTQESGQLVSQHVTALQNTIRSIVDEFGDLLGQLNTEAGVFTEVAGNLSEAGNFTIDTLKDRQHAMEALATSFTARADEVDERMRTFAQSISETVSDTERRLVTARRAMEEALDGTTDAVAERLESITDAAAGQGERAGEALRQVQERLISEMHMALDDATRRFGETADAMRTTASQVGSELEATRSELQRGMLELPEETKASAAAMRQVVAEQIEALNELNAIVRSQPSTHDVSGRRAAPPRETSAPRRSESFPSPRRNDQPSGGGEERSSIAALVRQDSGSRSSASSRDDSGSWLRDVLRNASANQQSGSSSRGNGGLNLRTLVEDVARAMDENALADAWQRYRNGENNVFSRRIYTLTGQGTYDDVRKKMQRDTEFARTAAIFMDEFEQVLSQAANDPRAAVTMEEHLASDRGKLYTMLAHANGRLS